jgi:tetratricopeptide (TPR) repeat protein
VSDGLHPSLVCEVYADRAGAGPNGFGSGYRIGPELVLTARHVVENADRCELRPLGAPEWLSASVAWCSDGSDAAVLRIPAQQSGTARLGRLAGDERVRCRALGFPLAQARGQRRDTEEIAGSVAPLTTVKAGRLAIHIDGSVPVTRDRGSPWEGMSGAAVFCGPLLVGIVIVAPAHFGTNRLAAVPISALEPSFHGLADLPDVLPAVEDEPARASLDPPTREQPRPDALRRSPSLLLHPELAIVPFDGRTRELESLDGWCAGDGLAVAVLIGRGGSGKTRLAAELCRARLEDGWVAGFLRPSADLDALVGASSPLLLVIDDAEAHARAAGALLDGLARRRGTSRVLLVARESGEWWERVLRRHAGLEVMLALERAPTLELGPLERDLEARRTAYRDAVAAFVARTGRSPMARAEPDLTDDSFDRVLFVHLAAIAAVEGDEPTVGARLLHSRLEREARYWEQTAAETGLTERDRWRAVAVATLVPAASEAEAASVLAAVPDLDGEANERLRRAIVGWLGSLYPGEGYLRPLEPDLLGEALVGRVLDDVPELASRLLARCTPAQLRRALGVLGRVAQRSETARLALGRALEENFTAIWDVAIDVAPEVGDPLGRLLAEALERTPRPELTRRIIRHLQHPTIVLRELSAVATEQLVESLARQPRSPERDDELAGLLNDLSIRLARTGRRDEALAASEQALQLFEHLAEAQPERYLPEVARTLLNHSNQLQAIGRAREAVFAAARSTEIREKLVQAHPETYLADYARSLKVLAARFSQFGGHEAALEPIEASVRNWRLLVERRGDAFLPEYADALNSLSVILGDLDRPAEALEPIALAVDIRRRLTESHPDAYRDLLATSLKNLSAPLSELGRYEDALAATAEAVDIMRELAGARPAVFLDELATCLLNLALGLRKLGRFDEALAAADEAIAAYRRLAGERPATFEGQLGEACEFRLRLLAAAGR